MVTKLPEVFRVSYAKRVIFLPRLQFLRTFLENWFLLQKGWRLVWTSWNSSDLDQQDARVTQSSRQNSSIIFSKKHERHYGQNGQWVRRARNRHPEDEGARMKIEGWVSVGKPKKSDGYCEWQKAQRMDRGTKRIRTKSYLRKTVFRSR